MRRKTKTDFDLVQVDDNPRQLRVVRPEIVEQWEDVQLPTKATQPAITAHVEGSYTDTGPKDSLSAPGSYRP